MPNKFELVLRMISEDNGLVEFNWEITVTIVTDDGLQIERRSGRIPVQTPREPEGQ